MKSILQRAKEKLGRYLKKGEIIHYTKYNFMIFANQNTHKRWHEGKKVDKKDILFDGRKEQV